MKALPHGDGDAEHPHRDHGREVERGDARRHAQRLAHGIDVDARARALGVLALQQRAGCRRRTRSPPGRAGCRPWRRRSPCRARTTAARPARPCRASSRRLNSNITRARRCGLTAAQAGWAGGGAGDGARPARATVASATRACTSPVLGSNTSPKRPERPATRATADEVAMLRMTRSFLACSKTRIRPCSDPVVGGVVAEDPAAAAVPP